MLSLICASLAANTYFPAATTPYHEHAVKSESVVASILNKIPTAPLLSLKTEEDITKFLTKEISMKYIELHLADHPFIKSLIRGNLEIKISLKANKIPTITTQYILQYENSSHPQKKHPRIVPSVVSRPSLTQNSLQTDTSFLSRSFKLYTGQTELPFQSFRLNGIHQGEKLGLKISDNLKVFEAEFWDNTHVYTISLPIYNTRYTLRYNTQAHSLTTQYTWSHSSTSVNLSYEFNNNQNTKNISVSYMYLF